MHNLKRKRLRVVGRVQGVGFRYFVKQEARKLGIVGHVWNLPNGEVGVDATGTPEDMALFVASVAKGPSASRVQQIYEQVLPLQDVAESFTITHF